MITVMYLIDTCLFPPAGLSVGGAEKQLHLLASSLDPALFKTVVVQLSPNKALRKADVKIGSFELFHFPTRRFYGVDGIRQIVRLCRLAKRKKVDIIHTIFEKSEVMGWLVRRLSGIPIWITSRRDLGFKRKDLYKKIFRLTAKDCSKCIANSVAVKDYAVRQENLSAEKMEVIYNGLELSAYQNTSPNGRVRKQLNICDGMPIVGMVANFNFEIKGHQFFLEAAKNILNDFSDVTFLLIGDGPLRKNYVHMANELGIQKNIRFLGKRNDVPLLMANMDISVLSSMSEGLSNVVLESMAAGKPVVATEVGGNSEMVIDGNNGFLVPPADASALAAAVIRLLKNPEEAGRMGSRGKQIVQEKFTVQAMVRSYEKLYLSLIEGIRKA